MALNTNNIYIGTAKMSFSILDRDFFNLDKKTLFTLNDISTFKAINESTFFGAYASNSAVKASAYNQLRANSFQVLNKMRTNGTFMKNVRRSFTDHPTVFSTLEARMTEVVTLKQTKNWTYNSSLFQKLYNFSNIQLKVYLPATFDTSSLKTEFKYKSNNTVAPYYTNDIIVDYLT
jgi:hypothetical protein